MTVTKEASLLHIFQSKIDEAVSYVPRMCPADKLKAVQFWNVVSEKLQDIVNNSAADINAVAMKMEENESEKITMEMNNSNNSVSHCSISSDFLNLPSNYGIVSGTTEQYHAVDIGNAQLLTSHSFASVTESSLNSTVGNIQHLNQLQNAINCDRNVSDHSLTVPNLSHSSCDTLVINSSCVTTVPSESIPCSKSTDYGCKEILAEETRQTFQSCETVENNPDDPDDPSPVNNSALVLNNLPVTKINKTSRKSNNEKLSLLKHFIPEENLNSSNKVDCDKKTSVSDTSESSKDSYSGNKSDFETTSHRESDSNLAEPVVSFVVSRTEEILTNNETGLNTELSHNTSVFSCKDCNKKFTESELAAHSWVHSKPYSCSDCSAQFSTKGNLMVHMRKHTGEKPFSCSKCTSRFTTKGNLKRHLKTHTGEKPFHCQHCTGRFTEKKSLIVHMRRHTGEKPYGCKVCGKSFSQTGVLQSHMAMHLNQKVHLCEKCGKSFRQKSQLHIHKLRHENVKKYRCSTCSSSFLTKGDYQRHMRIHTGERPYLCEICSKTFTRQQSLNEHMNRHSGARPYVCKYCSRAFAEMSACYKHMKQHEREQAKQSQEPAEETYTTESAKEISVFQEQVVPNSNTYRIIKLCKIDSPNLSTTDVPQKNDSAKTDSHQTLVTFIENFL